VRRADDALAWEAIRAGQPGNQVIVVMLGGDPIPQHAADLDVRPAGDGYDEVVRLIEWSEKVVAW
jgi:hypothetical protein